MLGQYLIKKSTITEEQLSQALERQVIMGGRLGTNLIELGALSEEELLTALGDFFGVPTASTEDLASIDVSLSKLVAKEIAEKYKVIPFKRERNTLYVAVLEPKNLKALDELQFITGCAIRPYVASEVRIMYALERVYEISRPLRYVSVLEKDREAASNNNSSSWIKKEHSQQELDALFSQAKEDWAHVNNRDEAIETLLRMGNAVLERAILFLVRPGGISGLKGFPAFRNPEIAQLQFKVEEVPVIAEAVQNKSSYQGPLPQAPPYSAISNLFGTESPEEVVFLPIILNKKIVAIFYGEKHGAKLSKPTMEFLANGTNKVALALEVLIFKSKIREM